MDFTLTGTLYRNPDGSPHDSLPFDTVLILGVVAVFVTRGLHGIRYRRYTELPSFGGRTWLGRSAVLRGIVDLVLAVVFLGFLYRFYNSPRR